MKKGVFAVFFMVITILAIATVFALNNSNPLAPFAQNATNTSSSVQEKSNELLSNQITIPENLQIFTRVIFGITTDAKINFQTFIILVCLWFVFLFLIKEILKMIPLVGKGIKRWIGAVLIMLLIAISGGLLLIADFILTLSKLFGILEGWSIVSLTIALILVFGILYLVSNLMKILKAHAGIEEAEKTGRDIGFAGLMGKITRESLKED